MCNAKIFPFISFTKSNATVGVRGSRLAIGATTGGSPLHDKINRVIVARFFEIGIIVGVTQECLPGIGATTSGLPLQKYYN